MGKLSMLERAVSSLDEAIRHLADAADFVSEADMEDESANISAIREQAKGFRSIVFELIGDEVGDMETKRRKED